jgi:hypothetical protein
MAEPGQSSKGSEAARAREHQQQLDAEHLKETLDPEQAEAFDSIFSPTSQAKIELTEPKVRHTHYGYMSGRDLGPVAESLYALIEAETEERQAARTDDPVVKRERLAMAAQFRQRAQEKRAQAE